RAENDGLDSISQNDAVLLGGLGYAAGKVGQAFNYNVSNGSKYARIPASSSLDVGAGSGITLDAWINVDASRSDQIPIFEWSKTSGGDFGQGVHFWVQA